MKRSVWVAVFAALLVFWSLDYAPFVNPDEGRYVSASYEMAFPFGEKSDWLVPHLNGITRLNKPPLVYWFSGASYRLFGPSERSGRLPAAFASLSVLLILYFWGAKIASKRAGAATALVWATATFPAAMGRTANTDMLLTATITLASFGLFWLVESPKKWHFGVLAGVGMGAALLCKGPVGVVFPLLGLGIYGILARRQIAFLNCVKPLAGALSLAFLIGLPWYFAVEARRPGFIWEFVLTENLGRFSGQEDFHDPTSKLFYLPVIFVGLLPWTAFLIPAISRLDLNNIKNRSRLFCWIWSVGIVLFFSFSHTKLISYILPAFPAFALLIGLIVADWEAVPRAPRRASIGVVILTGLILITALIAIPKREKLTGNWHFAPGVLMDDKIIAREIAAPYIGALAAILAFGIVGLLLVERRPSGRALMISQGATASATVVLLLLLANQILRHQDASTLLKTLAPRLESDDEVVNYRCFVPTTIFYARRPATFFHFKNTAGLNQKELDASPRYFQLKDPEENDLALWLSARQNRVFVVSHGFIEPPFDKTLFVWGRINSYFLLCNRPKPADFALDFVAPQKRAVPVNPKKLEPVNADDE